MVGFGGLIALIIFISFYLKVNLTFYLILTVLFSGITGSARLYLKAHTPFEIYIGFVTGLILVLTTMIIY